MNTRSRDITRFLLFVGFLVLLNVIAYVGFFRVDLTEDKRFSVAPTTETLLDDLDDKVYIKVYLHGSFPAKFKNLEKAIREKLDEMKVFAGSNLKISFIDPSALSDKTERSDLYRDLVSKGIQPTTLHANEEGKKIEKLIFPGAIVEYKTKATAINFLKGNQMASADVRINQAIETTEFEIASAIRRVVQAEKKKVAFIDGHGELSDALLSSIMSTLSENYMVGRLNIKTVPEIPAEISALVVAKPQGQFSESEKFKLDQYIMHGGKVLFFIDALEARKDSTGMVALPYDLNIEDLTFNYGIRFNKNMIQDLYAAPVPVNTGSQYQLMPWSFFPLLNRYAEHPITRNLDAVNAKNMGTMDTTFAPGIKKTALVYTSQYSKVKGQPVAYVADELRINLNKEYYTSGSLPVCFLLEGKFKSLYQGRAMPAGANVRSRLNESVENKLFFFSDGDMLANEIDQSTQKPFQLGQDRFSKQVYANTDFIRNAVDFMLDETGVVNLRSKSIQLRVLDKFKVEEEKNYWTVFNMISPLVLLLIFGIIRYFIRKRKYTHF